MKSPADAPRRKARRLFITVLGLSAFHCFFLIADRRVPLGHETGRLFGLQHAFANGDVPETPGVWAWVEQGTLLQNAVLPVSPSLRSVPFVPLFHLGMFLEEMLLLVGVWMLGSKYYRSSIGQFVASVAALGSCLWIDNAAVNLLAFSALPLILYLLHEFLETKARIPLLMAGLVAILQILGRPPTFALLVPAAAALYWAGAAILFGYPLRDKMSGLSRTKWDAWGAALLLLATLAVAGGALTGARNGIHAATGERWTFRAVATGAGFQNPMEYFDAMLGLSPSLDATCYCGIFTLAFAVIALRSLGLKKSLRLAGFLLGSLVVLSLIPLLCGALLALPTRPTPQGMPLLRMFVVFLAGFGCEKMREFRTLQPRLPRLPAIGLLFASAAMAVLFVFNPFDEGVIRHATTALTLGVPPVSVSPMLAQADVFRNLAGVGTLTSGLAGGTLLLWSSGWRRAPLALALILVLHPLDTFGWKFRMTWMKSSSLSPQQAEAQTLVNLPALPFPGVDPVLPPPPALLQGPYGAGPTPLRPVPKEEVSPGNPHAMHARSPLRIVCRGALGFLSIAVMGWILMRILQLGGAAPLCPRIP